MVAHRDNFEPVVPTAIDAEMARKTIPLLLQKGKAAGCVRVGSKGQGELVQLPKAAVQLLVDLLEQIAAGNAVTLIPVQKELSTQEAADLIGVSRPFVVMQMDAGAIPYRKVGTHRRVLVKDLLAYKRKMDSARAVSLDDLASEAQKLKMGY